MLGGWQGLLAASPQYAGSLTIAAGVTAMVGTFAVGSGGGSPDIQRWNKTTKHSWLVAVVTFGVAYPILMVSGAITALATDTTSIIDAYIRLGILVMGGFVIVLLTWTTCDADYYSASLSFSAVTGMKRERAVVLIVICACILALLRSAEILTQWLTAMAAIMVPLVGTVAADYYIINKGKYPEPHVALQKGAIPAWKISGFIALVVGAASLIIFNNLGIGIPVIQTMIVAGLIHIIFCKVIPQKVNFNDLINEVEKKAALNADPVE